MNGGGERKLEVVSEVKYQSGGGEKSFYQRLGTATPDRSGEGWNVWLNALPLTGKLWIRPIRERSDR